MPTATLLPENRDSAPFSATSAAPAEPPRKKIPAMAPPEAHPPIGPGRCRQHRDPLRESRPGPDRSPERGLGRRRGGRLPADRARGRGDEDVVSAETVRKREFYRRRRISTAWSCVGNRRYLCRPPCPKRRANVTPNRAMIKNNGGLQTLLARGPASRRPGASFARDCPGQSSGFRPAERKRGAGLAASSSEAYGWVNGFFCPDSTSPRPDRRCKGKQNSRGRPARLC
jgi:hypothetical protein